MSRRVKSVIYYNGQICNTGIRVLFTRAQSTKLAFNCSIQLRELQTKIRRKVGGLSWRRILSLKCRYLASLDLFKYELFHVTGDTELEAVLDSHCSSSNAILELHVEFREVDEAGLSSTNVPSHVGNEQEAESPITWLCGGFIALLQSDHYDILESSMRRHSSVSGPDFNFGNYSVHHSGYSSNLNFNTRAWHLVSAFDFDFNGMMS
ncbi:hypothetical protein J1N35_039786 [Gossypium stocksii]|uniref:Uncharacterized protein n=1 Tax=Gossypium stocksii TaxID=47602 RepID=A0A9D3UCU4_9ROSI|nr:hypothetical protein J1N35_039786 [Gossypium stocksii]